MTVWAKLEAPSFLPTMGSRQVTQKNAFQKTQGHQEKQLFDTNSKVLTTLVYVGKELAIHSLRSSDLIYHFLGKTQDMTCDTAGLPSLGTRKENPGPAAQN
jgi:hypothetical protein